MSTPTVEVKKTHEAFSGAPTISTSTWEALEGNSLVKLGDGVGAQISARVQGRMAAQYQREYNEAMARIDPKKVIKDRLTAKRAALITNQGTIDGFITSKLSQGVGHDEAEMMAMKYAGAMTYAGQLSTEMDGPSGSESGAAWSALNGHGTTPSGGGGGGAPAKKPRKKRN